MTFHKGGMDISRAGFLGYCAEEFDSRRHVPTLRCIFAMALAIRLIYISQPMRTDECWTYMDFVIRGLDAVVTRYTSTNNHILNSVFIWLSTSLFGDSPEAIRLPALFFGLCNVVLAYVLGSKMYNRSAGLMAAALLASSSIMIEYSTNGRGYTCIDTAFLMLLLLGMFLREHDSLPAWLGFSVVAALGCYTIPIMLYPLGGVLLWLALSGLLELPRARRKRFLFRLALSCALGGGLTLLLYTPVLLYSPTLALKSVNPDVLPKSFDYFLGRTVGIFDSAFYQWFRDIPPILTVLLVCFLAGGVFLHKRVATFKVPMLLPVAAWLVGLLLLQRVVPYQRVLLYLLPLVLITASGMAGYYLEKHVRKRTPHLFVPLILCVLCCTLCVGVYLRGSVMDSPQTGVLPDGKEIVRFLGENAKPGEPVASISGKWIMDYYFHRLGLERLNIPPEKGTEHQHPVWVVCNQNRHYFETWEQVLEMHLQGMVEPSRFKAELVREFPQTKVFRVTPRD